MLTALCLGVLNFLYAQLAPKKEFKALRTTETIKIDGVLDEAVWQAPATASGFTQLEPAPGLPSRQEAAIRVVYDDKALYVAAELFDVQPDSIMRQFSPRDEVGVTDYFGLVLDPYQDGQNGLGFIVTASGVQIDIKYSATNNNFNGAGVVFNGDTNWDAVWDSQVEITETGWVVEMKIPYMAIRFPKSAEQRWNVNFARMIRRFREQSFWNEVKPEQAGLLPQSGILTGISDITPPVRLSATPFVAAYAQNHYDKSATPTSSWGRSFNGGMDIKYGINDAFTLDMTLIPDFGEARSDNQVLNLSPFEIQFDENRPFFTEGIELFNKGGLFYSRRIGGRPLRYWEVEGDLATTVNEEGETVELEEVASNPQTTQLYNATKVSGRTAKGLGIGLFNATAARTVAQIRNLETREVREYETNPLTNYNVIVLDQNLKNNSYVSLINTHTLRNGAAYDANVTGVSFDLRNKANSYAVGGGGALSQLYEAEGVDLGHTARLSVGKISGQFNYWMGYNEESDTYNPNDLGILFANNERNLWWNAVYNIYEPFGAFNNANFGMYTEYNRLYAPSEFTTWGVNFWAGAQTKSFINFGAWTYFQPVASFDYFDPRSDDFSRYYRMPTFANLGAYLSTDYRKKIALDVQPNYGFVNSEGRSFMGINIAPRFRVSDKLFILLECTGNLEFKNEGYVNDTTRMVGETTIRDIFYGKRDVRRLSTAINLNYNFTNNMNVSFRLNHNWATVTYHSFHLLGENGDLLDTDYSAFHDTNFNAFNIDTIYRWRFAPGSDLFFIWKNVILAEEELTRIGYSENLRRLLDLPLTNSFSLKVVYFLDYLNLVKQG